MKQTVYDVYYIRDVLGKSCNVIWISNIRDINMAHKYLASYYLSDRRMGHRVTEFEIREREITI